MKTTRLSDPAVRAFVTALNSQDREAFLATLAPDATMADDGDDRDLDQWIDREIFSSHGHMEVDSESDGGRSLLARYRNDTWGEMRTRWRFTVDDAGRIARFETGQA
ncbi:nuclear transport factor 2 family protein [Streptomyces tagetis]|uniref:Nuclear transport factor 2 family protein n=1 Tax=Streptomyces tagetis TaxID=2820809 RepID=A0A940XGR9_9ACTN|nr:nuclear transport factor 2 family protein [Streptomyces sp. RG38]MBQ0830103.1 nuclear transport factor 2 family protein [Streptomyces sp. RG38]